MTSSYPLSKQYPLSQKPVAFDDQALPIKKPNAGTNQIPEYKPGEELNENEATMGELIAQNKMAAAKPLIYIFLGAVGAYNFL